MAEKTLSLMDMDEKLGAANADLPVLSAAMEFFTHSSSDEVVKGIQAGIFRAQCQIAEVVDALNEMRNAKQN